MTDQGTGRVILFAGHMVDLLHAFVGPASMSRNVTIVFSVSCSAVGASLSVML